MKRLILDEGLGDQNQILEAMVKKGFATTQATISRDLQEMGFVKTRLRSGIYKYELLDRTSQDVLWDRLKLLFHNFVMEIKSTGNLLLIKTSPGNAHGVASLIDGLSQPEILGTVAGDDTILVVVEGPRKRAEVERSFRRLF